MPFYRSPYRNPSDVLVVVFIALIALAVVGGVGYAIWWNLKYKCVASHVVIRHRPLTCHTTHVGKTSTMTCSGGYDYEDDVCDVWEER